MLHRIPRVILLMLLRNEHFNMIGTLFSKKKNKDKEVELIGYERASRLVLWLLVHHARPCARRRLNGKSNGTGKHSEHR